MEFLTMQWMVRFFVVMFLAVGRAQGSSRHRTRDIVETATATENRNSRRLDYEFGRAAPRTHLEDQLDMER